MASLIDKFTSNALQTPVGLMISRASDEVLPADDWSLIMEICDYVNTREEGPKDAARAIRKRLQITKSAKSILYTLTILETCMKNCGYRFQINICQKEYIQDLVKLLQPARNPSLAVQEKIVWLIQNWTDAFANHPDLKGVAVIHEELRMKGIIFPESDPGDVKLLKTAGGVGFGTQIAQQDFPVRSATFSASQTVHRQTPEPAVNTVRRPPPVPSEVPAPAVSNPEQPKPLNQSQVHKLQRDLDVVQTNCRILSDMLNQLNPGEEEAAEYALLKDLNLVCRQMQSRLVELIEQVSTEEITCELLRVNDELNQAFVRYDRYERIREVHLKKSQATAQNSVLFGADQAVAPTRNKSSLGDIFDGGDANFDVPVLPTGGTVPVIRKRADAPPAGTLPPVRATNMPQLSSNMEVMTLEEPGGASGFSNTSSTNAASNPTYEELLFTATSQSPRGMDAFGASGETDGGATANGTGLSEQDIESFLNEEASANYNQQPKQPVTVKPAQSFLNPFES
ncbi:TOM1-like protein 2 [Convolutriloba macropyga]|uniref:TOM1-like protein 2 n=1 Tax=Convolutriloba macropyga TaxID=536237 RepID=UPI003F523F4A